MKTSFLIGLRLTAVCAVLFCGLYIFSILGISKLVPEDIAFAKNESGFYENVGQAFTTDRYFWSRPSAVDYNAAASGGSNKGPSNPEYLATVKARIDTLLAHNPGLKKSDIPSDLVTASGSGLDANISVASAQIQVNRIAKVRNIEIEKLKKLVEAHIEKPFLGVFGTTKINVVKLNAALDALK